MGTDSDHDGEIETFNVTKTLPSGVTSSNRRKTVEEGDTYKTTLSGIKENHVVTVKLGSNDVTSTAYDEETNKIEKSPENLKAEIVTEPVVEEPVVEEPTVEEPEVEEPIYFIRLKKL